METKHTPHYALCKDGPDGVMSTGDGSVIEEVIARFPDAWLTDTKWDRARQIVRACNAHDKLVRAAQRLLQDARDNGECFIDEDDEQYDAEKPEQMYADWAALQAAVDNATTEDPAQADRAAAEEGE